VLDRELEEEKSHDPSGPRIRCPQCGWSPRKDLVQSDSRSSNARLFGSPVFSETSNACRISSGDISETRLRLA
jgi:hypothetical protein